MVLSIVLKVNVPSDMLVEQYKEKLEKRVELLKPEKSLIPFQVQTIVYSPMMNGQPSNLLTVNQFLHSDFPASCFAIIDPPQQNEVIFLIVTFIVVNIIHSKN